MSLDTEILGVALEIVALRRKLADLGLSDPSRIADILGNEMSKRVIEVAAVQKHTIGFVGRETAQKLVVIAAQFGVPAFACQTCPCGNYGNLRQECRCSVAEIRKYQKTKPVQLVKGADIVVEVDEFVPPNSPKGEDAAAIQGRIQKAVERLQKVDEDNKGEYKESADCGSLMKLAMSDLSLTTERALKVRSVAMSCMALGGDDKVQPHYMVEAIQYVALRMSVFI